MDEENVTEMELEDNIEPSYEPDPDTKRLRLQGDGGRCKKELSRRTYQKKRKFSGNQHTKNNNKTKVTKTVSEKKVKRVKKQKKSNPIEGYRLMDMEILNEMVTSLSCPQCYELSLEVSEDDAKKKGLASQLIISCTECEFVLKNTLLKM